MKKQTHLLLFLAITLIGFLLRIFSLKTNGLWIDEIWSMLSSASQNSVSDIILICKADTHPPLFDIILHYTLILFNDAEFAGRYLALFFGMLGLFATYYYAKRISQKEKVALLAMTIVAFNHFHILYSIESRFYTFIYLLSLIVISEFFLYLKNGNTKPLIAFSIASILLVYTHYYGGILLASLGIIALALFISKKITRSSFLKFAGSCLVILLSFLPWLPHMLNKNSGSSWMSKPSLVDFIDYYYLYSGKNPLEFLLLFIPLLFAFRIFRKNTILLWVLYGSILLGFIIPYLVSNLSTPMLHRRYTFIYLPSIYFMAAFFWYEMPQLKPKLKKIGYTLILLFTCINIFFLRKEYQDNQKDQWKEVSAYIEKTDKLSVYTEHSKYLNYYLTQNAEDLTAIKTEKTEPFWLLRTNYDEKNPLEEMGLIVLDKKTFPNKFDLYKVKNP